MRHSRKQVVIGDAADDDFRSTQVAQTAERLDQTFEQVVEGVSQKLGGSIRTSRIGKEHDDRRLLFSPAQITLVNSLQEFRRSQGAEASYDTKNGFIRYFSHG